MQSLEDLFEPLEDKVVIEQFQGENKTAGGLFIPESSKEKPQKGVVVAVGAGRTLECGLHLPCKLRIGDTVIFQRLAGHTIQINGKEYRIMFEKEVYGKYKYNSGSVC